MGTGPYGDRVPRPPMPRPRRLPLPGSLLRLDERAFRAVRTRLGRPPLVGVALGFSHFGEHAAGWLLLGAAGAALDHRRRPAWARATSSVFVAHALNVGVKRVVRRPRPAFADLPALGRTPSRLSFPSAHAASSSAAAAAFAPLLPALPWRTALGAMVLSRVALGVHYPSDVLAGAVLGRAVAAVVTAPDRRRRG